MPKATTKQRTSKPAAQKPKASTPTARKPKASKTTRGREGHKRPSPTTPLSRLPRYLLWTLLTILGAIILYFTLRIIIDGTFNIRARFGDIVYPAGTVRGIDISHYQTDIDWDRLRNAQIDGVPVSFILIKATEGTTIIDENFNQNFHHAHHSGIRRGAYHFLTTQSDPRRQAEHYCRIVQLDEGDIAPILDVERLDGMTPAALRQHVLTWMNHVEQHYGITPILYTSYKFRTDYLNTPEFDHYPLWIAHYYVDHLRYKGHWAIWQHTDRGTVDGIKGHVDLNVLNGTTDDLDRLTIKNTD